MMRSGANSAKMMECERQNHRVETDTVPESEETSSVGMPQRLLKSWCTENKCTFELAHALHRCT